MDGSEGLFHEVSSIFSLVLVFVINSMEAKNTSHGFLKLSQITILEAESSKTRLPESRIRALTMVAEEETLVDQRRLWFPSNTTRFPSSEIVKIPEESLTGLSLLATHTTVCGEIWLLNQIPTWRFVELAGEKNPSWKELAFETMVAGSLMEVVDVIVSLLPELNLVQKYENERRRRRRRLEKLKSFSGFMAVVGYKFV